MSNTSFVRIDGIVRESSDCKTPGAIYSSEVHSQDERNEISFKVSLPSHVHLSASDAIEIEIKAHDFFEDLLAKHFVKNTGE